jgi:hypothetical protein
MLSPPGQSPISSSAPWQEDKSAETFRVNGGLDRVGIIGSVTRPFCGTCDRVRLTADGQVRNCLFAATETGLRASLRSVASNDQLAGFWRTAVAGKLPGHGDPGFLQPARPTSAIGGLSHHLHLVARVPLAIFNVRISSGLRGRRTRSAPLTLDPHPLMRDVAATRMTGQG